MRAVVTVVGKDMVGILAEVSGKCAAYGINIVEVTQSILQDMFCMIMLVDMANSTCKLEEFSSRMQALGEQKQLSIHVMHADVFDTMHHI